MTAGDHYCNALSRHMTMCVQILARLPPLQAFYYLLAKHLVGKYNPVCIAAWAYIVAASLMGVTAMVTVQRNEWTVPKAMLGPLLYWCAGSYLCAAGLYMTRNMFMELLEQHHDLEQLMLGIRQICGSSC